MFKAKNKGYFYITLMILLDCGDHGYIFSGKLGCYA
jgi:hypothetical protein